MEKWKKIGNILMHVLWIATAIFLFLWLVHPILTIFVIPPLSVHKQVEHYTSGRYVNFEDGELFQDFTESVELANSGEVVDFYHVNHWVRDNPFRGKHSDFFVLDVHLEEGKYTQAKELLQDEAAYGEPAKWDDYQACQWKPEGTTNTYMIACCDEDQILRLVLITETEGDYVLPTAFAMHTGVSWESSGDS